MLLKQDLIYGYLDKGKWCEMWYLCTYTNDGAVFTLYKDKNVKKAEKADIRLKRVANKIRFGTTCEHLVDLPDPGDDVRIDRSSFIAIFDENSLNSYKKPRIFWLCAKSVLDMFDLLKIISQCQSDQGLPAPEFDDDDDDRLALHNYRPIPFDPYSAWERYYDNPSKSIRITLDASMLQRSTSMELVQTKGIMSHFKRRKAIKRLCSTQSTTALNEISNIRDAKSPFNPLRKNTVSPDAITKVAEIEILSKNAELCEQPLTKQSYLMDMSERNKENMILMASQMYEPAQGATKESSVTFAESATKASPLGASQAVTENVEAQTDISLIAMSRTVIIETISEPIDCNHAEWQMVATEKMPADGGDNVESESLHIKVEELKKIQKTRRSHSPFNNKNNFYDESTIELAQQTVQTGQPEHLSVDSNTSITEEIRILQREEEAEIYK